MSRGPEPLKGYNAALPVARARGHTMFFRRERGNTADLMVSGSGSLAIIAIRFAPRLAGSPAAVAAEFRDAVLLLRLHPAGGPVSRELWLYNRYGVLQFFRVEDAGIVEIGADGSVMASGDTHPAAQPAGALADTIPSTPVSPAISEDCTNPGMGNCSDLPSIASSGVPDAPAGTGGFPIPQVTIECDRPEARDLPAANASTMTTKKPAKEE